MQGTGPDSSFDELIYYCTCTTLLYRIAGKFDRELNLAVWQSTFATAKLKSTNISYLHILHIHVRLSCTKSLNLNLPIFLWNGDLGPNQLYGVPPNLYSVCLSSSPSCVGALPHPGHHLRGHGGHKEAAADCDDSGPPEEGGHQPLDKVGHLGH